MELATSKYTDAPSRLTATAVLTGWIRSDGSPIDQRKEVTLGLARIAAAIESLLRFAKGHAPFRRDHGGGQMGVRIVNRLVDRFGKDCRQPKDEVVAHLAYRLERVFRASHATIVPTNR